MATRKLSRQSELMFQSNPRRWSRDEERVLFGRLRRLRAAAAELERGAERANSLQIPNTYRARELATRIRNRMVQANLPLVCSVAKRFASAARPLPELMSDGVISLIRAIEKFDERRGFKFSTYATVALTRSYLRGRENDRRHSRRYRSCTEETAFFDQAEPAPRESESAALRDALRQVLHQLDARDRSVISQRFGLECGAPGTLEQVGRRLGISKERTRQIEIRAMERVRSMANAAQLQDYLN